MQGLTTGRIVHFLDSHYEHGKPHYAAIITRVLSQEGWVDLVVFQLEHQQPALIIDNVRHDSNAEQPLSWHWIERA